MKLLITTGGTGGHIYPALALADVAQKETLFSPTIFVGSKDRMEATVIPEYGYSYYGMDVVGMHKGLKNKIEILWKMSRAYMQARKILKKEAPDIVLGFGGYVSGPVMLAAIHKGIPTLLHEQNSIMGKSNRLLEKKVNGVITCYEEVTYQLKNPNVRCLGNPRETVVATMEPDIEYVKTIGMVPGERNILIVMGSLGSSSMNQMISSCLESLAEMKINITWVTGKDAYIELSDMKLPQNVRIIPYVEQSKVLQQAEFVVCRAGATTIAELCSIGVASILIPSPYVANDHQRYNANALLNQDAAIVLDEQTLTEEEFIASVQHLLDHPEDIKKMKEQAKKLGHPKAAKDILEWCKEMKR